MPSSTARQTAPNTPHQRVAIQLDNRRYHLLPPSRQLPSRVSSEQRQGLPRRVCRQAGCRSTWSNRCFSPRPVPHSLNGLSDSLAAGPLLSRTRISGRSGARTTTIGIRCLRCPILLALLALLALMAFMSRIFMRLTYLMASITWRRTRPKKISGTKTRVITRISSPGSCR